MLKTLMRRTSSEWGCVLRKTQRWQSREGMMDFKTYLKRMKGSFARKSSETPDKATDDVLPYSIYENPTGTRKGLVERNHWVNYFFKTKILKPGLITYRWLFDDKLTTIQNIPSHPEHGLIHAFNRAYDQSLVDWWHTYRMPKVNINKKTQPLDEDYWRTQYEKLMSNHVNKDLLCLKKTLLTIYANDTAYREWMNTLLLNIAREVIEVTKSRGGNYAHLVFPNFQMTDDQLVYTYHRMYPTTQKQYGEVKQGLNIIPVYNSRDDAAAQRIIKHVEDCSWCCKEIKEELGIETENHFEVDE